MKWSTFTCSSLWHLFNFSIANKVANSRSLIKQAVIIYFKASQAWLFAFMRRNKLFVGVPTSPRSKLKISKWISSTFYFSANCTVHRKGAHTSPSTPRAMKRTGSPWCWSVQLTAESCLHTLCSNLKHFRKVWNGLREHREVPSKRVDGQPTGLRQYAATSMGRLVRERGPQLHGRLQYEKARVRRNLRLDYWCLAGA